MRTSAGYSLIELIISIAITGVLLSGIVAMQLLTVRETSSLSERAAVLMLAKNISTVIVDPNICFSLFDSTNFASGNLPFNAATVSPTSPYKLVLNAIPGVPGGPKVLDYVNMADPDSAKLVLRKATDSPAGIELWISNMNPPTAILNINFDQSKLTHAVHNLSFPILIKTAPLGGQTTVKGCVGANG